MNAAIDGDRVPKPIEADGLADIAAIQQFEARYCRYLHANAGVDHRHTEIRLTDADQGHPAPVANEQPLPQPPRAMLHGPDTSAAPTNSPSTCRSEIIGTTVGSASGHPDRQTRQR
ncbi:hypothetical protein [Nocardia sp. NPDC052112]|uniref:hypothetical protein n=1 Tax=Nocardia sp. NPDC052112 TaxID=3155646 RepID=UPI003421DFA0